MRSFKFGARAAAAMLDAVVAEPAMAALGKQFAAAKPKNGLVIIAEEDHFAGDERTMTEVANRVGADTAKLSGVGHWWMCQQPAVAADMLMKHWA